MSLNNYIVINDKFELEETGNDAFNFPCCVCKHRHGEQDAEPCRTCNHNLNSVDENATPF